MLIRASKLLELLWGKKPNLGPLDGWVKTEKIYFANVRRETYPLIAQFHIYG